jgi:ferrous iron transport protein B
VAVSDDERVARDIVLEAEDAALVQVADAKDLRRSLLLTLELADAGVPFALDLNMTDEAGLRGVAIDDERLSTILGVPVVPTVATRRSGVEALGGALHETRAARVRTTFAPAIERAVEAIEPLLPADGVRPRALALMLLADGSNLAARLDLSARARAEILRARGDAERALGGSVAYALNRTRLAEADRIVTEVVRWIPTRPPAAERIASLAADRIWGWPVLAAVLLAVYVVVGRFGAGTVVGWLENEVFGRVVNPWARHAAAAIPIGVVERFLVGRYGLVTMALTYGLAMCCRSSRRSSSRSASLRTRATFPGWRSCWTGRSAGSGSTARPCCRWSSGSAA